MSEQGWVKSGDDSVGIKEAGFKVLQVFTVKDCIGEEPDIWSVYLLLAFLSNSPCT